MAWPPSRPERRSQRLRFCLLALATLLLPLSGAGAGDGSDPQSLRPLLLAPSKTAPDRGERHRATLYRSGLKRDVRQLERKLIRREPPPGARRETRSRLSIRAQRNARSGELRRIERALPRRSR